MVDEDPDVRELPPINLPPLDDDEEITIDLDQPEREKEKPKAYSLDPIPNPDEEIPEVELEPDFSDQ